MAQHKAPTAVTVAPVSEKSRPAEWIEKTWKPAAVLVVLITALILWRQSQSETKRRVEDESWSTLMATAEIGPDFGVLGDPEELVRAHDRLQGGIAAPWALFAAARSAVESGEFAEAEEALRQLKAEHPEHELVRGQIPYAADRKSSPADFLLERCAAMAAWRAEHESLFANPAPPADAPRVRLKTSEGEITVQLYPEAAPKHVENFLKLCSEGYYTNTKFHRVIEGFMIQGGDPNTIDGDPSTWGQGGPDYKVDPEPNDLKHFPGVLSMAKTGGEAQSSGSQFFITTGSPHHLDGVHVVFGKVIEGMDVVRRIESGEIAQGSTDRPRSPVVLQATEVLN